jgi:hypothetical protein
MRKYQMYRKAVLRPAKAARNKALEEYVEYLRQRVIDPSGWAEDSDPSAYLEYIARTKGEKALLRLTLHPLLCPEAQRLHDAQCAYAKALRRYKALKASEPSSLNPLPFLKQKVQQLLVRAHIIK